MIPALGAAGMGGGEIASLGSSGYFSAGGDRAYQFREVVLQLQPDRLRLLVNEKGMTLSDLARAVGLTRSGLANWLDGVVTPPSRRLITVAEVLGVSVEQFCRVRSVR